MKILVLNSGSSSQKSALYELGDSLPQDPPAPLWEAKIEWDRDSTGLTVSTADGCKLHEKTSAKDRQSATERMLDTLWNGPTRACRSVSEINVVGHRIVHGGPKLSEPVLITPEVKSIIASVAGFAPLHNRAELEGIEIVERLIGRVPQVAVFDTGFHRTIPLPAAVYPGPYDWYKQGIRRYGFHGINHEYCAERAGQLLKQDLQPLKMVSCHLGNGCSLAAIAGGKSIDTTMGFTPLEGLMMGTRSGSIDPGILTYLMRQSPITGDDIDAMLNKSSGLLGISGVSGDMREVLAAMKEGNTRARLAFDIYVHRLQSGIAGMAASLSGLDVLIFTAGVGEHASEVRSATCTQLKFLGIELDSAKNDESPVDEEISIASSKVRVLIIRAQEDWAIAKACWKIKEQENHRPHGGSQRN